MPSKLITQAIIFLVLGVYKVARKRGKVGPAARTRLIIAVFLGAVSIFVIR